MLDPMTPEQQRFRQRCLQLIDRDGFRVPNSNVWLLNKDNVELVYDTGRLIVRELGPIKPLPAPDGRIDSIQQVVVAWDDRSHPHNRSVKRLSEWLDRHLVLEDMADV